MLSRCIFVVILAGTWLAAPSVTAAADLPQPAGRVILEVKGKIGVTNADGLARFDRAMIEALGLSRMRTTTSWTQGVATFEGVELARLLQAVKASGTVLRVQALNDYQADIPLSDVERWNPILAMRQDGKDLQIRDKGPLWVIYPWSEHPEIDLTLTNPRSVWQVRRIIVD